MLINGQHVQTNVYDLDQLIGQLNALPSGFEHRNNRRTVVLFDSTSDIARYNAEGMDGFRKWQSSRENADLEAGLSAFQKAADASLREGNVPARAHNLSSYGRLCRLSGRNEQAIPALEAAVTLREQCDHPDKLYADLGLLHAALLDTIESKEQEGLAGEADQLRAKLKPLRQHSLKVQSAQSGLVPVNPKAYRVEQGEIGLSSDQPMGTDNVHDCVCVVIRDPETKKTGLAHIDFQTKISSLQVMLNRLPKRGPPNKPLEARLIGATLQPHPKGAAFDVDPARVNLEKILRFLDDHHVDVLSANIFDRNQPTAIVVDPKTFKISEEIPGLPNPNMNLGNARPVVGDRRKALHLAFDLTSSVERAPVFLPESEVMKLQQCFAGKSEREIYAWFKSHTKYHDAQLPIAVEDVIQLGEAYQQSVDQVVARLDKKIADLQEQGVHVDDSEKKTLGRMIGARPMHVGHGAEKANQPLVDYIEQKLFSAEPDHSGAVDFKGLMNFRFPDQPYATIEASMAGDSSQQARLAQQGAGQKIHQKRT